MATSPFISNFNIKTPFDEINLYKINNNSNNLKRNQTQNFGFIINNEEDLNSKDNILDNRINIEVNYNDFNNEEKCENYIIKPEEISDGEELFKLIINNYILNNSCKNDDEKEKLALKYQIFSKYTSLFAEIEFSEKINEEMKQKIIGDKENNQINNHNLGNLMEDFERVKSIAKSIGKLLKKQSAKIENLGSSYCSKPRSESNFSFLKPIGDSIEGIFSFENKSEADCSIKKDSYDKKMCCDSCNLNENNINKESYIENFETKINKEENKNFNENKREEKININDKEGIMKIINTQDFVIGCWDINDKTMIIKEKYEKEFGLLKNIKNKNIDDKIAITIIIIYFIRKEHSDLFNELIMIIKKGKIFIHDKTKETYEFFIKEIGLSD